MSGDAEEDIAEIGEGLYPDEPAALGKRVEQGRPVKARHASGEEPVLSTEGHRAKLVLGSIVVDSEPAILNETV
jgi:hypothetical protein